MVALFRSGLWFLRFVFCGTDSCWAIMLNVEPITLSLCPCPCFLGNSERADALKSVCVFILALPPVFLPEPTVAYGARDQQLDHRGEVRCRKA